jgi:hypothetical protein
VSATGTLYHIQIEDRGPILDPLVEQEVRRLNVIVYANYGEANARIIHGRDHDFEDVRSQEYNKYVEQKIQDLASRAKDVIEEKERRQVERIKSLVRQYYLTKEETAKREFEEANSAYPFLFSRAWKELKDEKVRAAPPPPEPVRPPELEVEALAEDVLYPLDPLLRERVLDIERIVLELGRDLQQLKAQGAADDILLQTCRKLVARAKESITGRDASEFNVKRLDMTRNSLTTTWRQVRSRLRA